MNRQKVLWFICALILATGFQSQADSLFDERTYEGLTSDLSARRVGDAVTVLIWEDASAAASAGARTDRSAQGQLQAQDTTGEIGGNIGFSSDFNGDGQIRRSGRLVGRVSVRVEQVADSGEMLVSGTQKIHFNQETQSISVRGWVRPADISDDNTVLSTRLSNATIEYTGEGLLGDSEKRGLLSRVLSWVF